MTPSIRPTVEELAQELHEAGRKAVESGNTVAAEKFGEKTRTFIEWADLPEAAREGRRIHAKYLMDKMSIMVRQNRVTHPDYTHEISGIQQELIDNIADVIVNVFDDESVDDNVPEDTAGRITHALLELFTITSKPVVTIASATTLAE